MPFICTVTPARLAGSGTLSATALREARSLPNKEAIAAPAKGCLVKLAPFTVPPGLTVGLFSASLAKKASHAPPQSSLEGIRRRKVKGGGPSRHVRVACCVHTDSVSI